MGLEARRVELELPEGILPDDLATRIKIRFGLTAPIYLDDLFERMCRAGMVEAALLVFDYLLGNGQLVAAIAAPPDALPVSCRVERGEYAFRLLVDLTGAGGKNTVCWEIRDFQGVPVIYPCPLRLAGSQA